MTGKETLRIVAQAIEHAEHAAYQAHLDDPESAAAIAAVEATARFIANALKRESPRFNRERFLAEALPLASERVRTKIRESVQR